MIKYSLFSNIYILFFYEKNTNKIVNKQFINFIMKIQFFNIQNIKYSNFFNILSKKKYIIKLNLEIKQLFRFKKRKRIFIFNDLYLLFSISIFQNLKTKHINLTITTVQNLDNIFEMFKQICLVNNIMKYKLNSFQIFIKFSLNDLKVFKYEQKYDKIVCLFPSLILKKHSIKNILKVIKNFLTIAKNITGYNGQIILLFNKLSVEFKSIKFHNLYNWKLIINVVNLTLIHIYNTLILDSKNFKFSNVLLNIFENV